MDKIHVVAEQYRQFLLQRQFATEKTAGYMQTWVEQFLHFACNYRDEPFEQVLIRFEDALAQKGAVEAWQIKQANDAITLYHFHFRHHECAAHSTTKPDNPDAVIQKVHEWMRIRHYALRTEKSYVHWIVRFLHFADSQGGKGELTIHDFTGLSAIWQ